MTLENKTFQKESFFESKGWFFVRKTIIYGGDYNDYNDYGNSFDERGYDLQGIVVTPNGNYTEDDFWNIHDIWDDNDFFLDDNSNNNDIPWYENNDSNGNNSPISEDIQISNGKIIANAIKDSIHNGSALYIEKTSETKITDTKGYKAATVANFGTNFALSEMDVYSTIMDSKTILKSFGGVLGAANAIGGCVIAYFALNDGEITPSDIWGAASAFFGIVGYGLGYVYPPAALVIGGVSIICGVISLATSNSNNNNNSNSIY